jgi:hypothetical protein
MPVYGYAARTSAEVLAAAGAIVFDDMSRLPELLAGDDSGGARRSNWDCSSMGRMRR